MEMSRALEIRNSFREDDAVDEDLFLVRIN